MAPLPTPRPPPFHHPPGARRRTHPSPPLLSTAAMESAAAPDLVSNSSSPRAYLNLCFGSLSPRFLSPSPHPTSLLLQQGLPAEWPIGSILQHSQWVPQQSAGLQGAASRPTLFAGSRCHDAVHTACSTECETQGTCPAASSTTIGGRKSFTSQEGASVSAAPRLDRRVHTSRLRSGVNWTPATTTTLRNDSTMHPGTQFQDRMLEDFHCAIVRPLAASSSPVKLWISQSNSSSPAPPLQVTSALGYFFCSPLERFAVQSPLPFIYLTSVANDIVKSYLLRVGVAAIDGIIFHLHPNRESAVADVISSAGRILRAHNFKFRIRASNLLQPDRITDPPKMGGRCNRWLICSQGLVLPSRQH
jgi:hypothetical protein